MAEDECVVFQAAIEDNLTVRSGATVAGDFVLREGTIVPESAVVTNQVEADALPVRYFHRRSEGKKTAGRLICLHV